MEEKNTIVVWAGLRVKDGLAEKFMQTVAPVIKATRAEKGCLKYDLLQNTEDECKFYFFEEYADEDGYAAHRAMPYMSEFRPKREEMLDRYLGLRVLKDK